MVTLFTKLFMKPETDSQQERQLYGVICGLLGIFFNLCLFAGKLFAGTISASIAIIADAFNNLSDAGSSIVTLIGFRLAKQKPDPEHPFGHGRLEYVAGLAVAMIILVMGVELLKSSVEKIITPDEIASNDLIFVILLASILIKSYMFYYNNQVSKKISSPTIHAAALDSLSDCAATAMVLLSALCYRFFAWNIDGYMGLLVSFFILYSGYEAARETLSPLLGMAPDPKLVKEIEAIVKSCPGVSGMHDLIIHDYGPYRRMVTLHAEMPVESDILKMHEVIDEAEHQLKKHLNCDVTIHLDPVVMDDEIAAKMRKAIQAMLLEIDENISMHDFRMVEHAAHPKIIFDIAVPYQIKKSDEALREEIEKKVQELAPDYRISVNVDRK